MTLKKSTIYRELSAKQRNYPVKPDPYHRAPFKDCLQSVVSAAFFSLGSMTRSTEQMDETISCGQSWWNPLMGRSFSRVLQKRKSEIQLNRSNAYTITYRFKLEEVNSWSLQKQVHHLYFKHEVKEKLGIHRALLFSKI